MTDATDVVETFEDLAESNREKATQAEEIDADPERLRGCAEAYDDAAGCVEEQLVGEQRLTFPDDATYDDFRYLINGLARVMAHVQQAAMSGVYETEGPTETLRAVHDFQIELLRANPHAAELMLEEVETGDAIALGSTEGLEQIIEEELGDDDRGEA